MRKSYMRFRLVEEDALKNPEVKEIIDELPEEEQMTTKYLLSKLDMRAEAIDNPNDVTRALDHSLKIVLRVMKHNRDASDDAMVGAYQKQDRTPGAAANVLLVGGAGTGKSSVVRQWAQARKINLVQKTAAGMDKTDINGGVARENDEAGVGLNTMTRLTNKEFDSLQKPGSVLFLDELNRADPDVVGSLLTLILDHKIPDNYSEGGMKFLRGYLFTVAAINPATDDATYDVSELDNALLDRFRQIPVFTDVPQYRRHLLKELAHDVKVDKEDYEDDPSEYNKEALLESERKVALVERILSSPMFEFDSVEDEAKARAAKLPGAPFLQNKLLTSRGFSALVRSCDGTKEDFLRQWPDFCNIEKLPMVEDILADYEDIDDKANDALKYVNGVGKSSENKSIFGGNMWDDNDLDAELM